MIRDSLPLTLLATTTISASGVGTAVTDVAGYAGLLAQLNCSAVPAGGTPTLDVYLQTSVDGGTTWQDIAHTQFTTSAAVRFVQIAGDAAGSTSPLAASDAALAGETVHQGPWGDRFRIRYVFVAGGSTGTYQLTARGYVK